MEDGYIEPGIPREQVRQDPFPLPKDFEWVTIDLDDQGQVSLSFNSRLFCLLNIVRQTKEVYDLLSLNYVEDDHATFRFQYTAEFLEWYNFHTFCTRPLRKLILSL